MNKKEEMKRRIQSESMASSRITNDDLICKDCIFRFDDSELLGNTSRCVKFEDKPNIVYSEDGDCSEYEKE